MTATDQDGVVHVLTQADPNQTECGRNATGWSRAVTIAQERGLVLFCEACK